LKALGGIADVTRHVARIRSELEHRPYFEAGWPAYAALPWLYEALDGRLRIVHLARHPVNTAFSMATHRIYDRDDKRRTLKDQLVAWGLRGRPGT
jgi:hypothetical protein